MDDIRLPEKLGKSRPATIAVAYLRGENGEMDRIRAIEFRPGMTVQRCGRRYRIDEKGIQRRIK